VTFMLQIYFNGAGERIEQLPEVERDAVFAEFGAFMQQPEIKDGNQLQPPATAVTVSLAEGKVVQTDGPNSATAEPLAGYYLVETEDIDRAVELAARNPAVRLGATVEVRPLIAR